MNSKLMIFLVFTMMFVVGVWFVYVHASLQLESGGGCSVCY
jgi:hypothetical protein